MHLAAQEREMAIKRCTVVMSLVPVSGLSWSAGGYGQVGKEALSVLEELETRFPGRIFAHFILYILRMFHERMKTFFQQCDNTTATRPSLATQ